MKSFKQFIKEGWENAVASFSGKPSITSGPPISNAIDPYPTAFSKGRKKKKAEFDKKKPDVIEPDDDDD
jgi:hypothetical protein